VDHATNDPGAPDEAREAEEASVDYSAPRAAFGTFTLKPPDPKRRSWASAGSFTFTRDDPCYDDTLADTSPDMSDDNNGPEPFTMSAKQ
jgi:hypothetical protein